MPGKIFISCGQDSAEERQVAADLDVWLCGQGFNPYLAIQTQSLQDVDSGIIGNLKTSDYYIFIDFARDQIGALAGGIPEYRGSLFTHQELAIAYLIDFEHVIFLRERNVRLEGLGRYLLSNARIFDRKDEALPLIQSEIANRNWDVLYSKQLAVSNLIYAGAWKFVDHARSGDEHIWHINVENRRRDIPAFNTIVRLDKITIPNGSIIHSRDRNFLKWAGKTKTFSTTIIQGDNASFDCFALDYHQPSHLYLHSEEDRPPRQPIISSPGHYILHYQILAIGFDIAEFNIELDLTGTFNTTNARLI